jgi:hypothetical protein
VKKLNWGAVWLPGQKKICLSGQLCPKSMNGQSILGFSGLLSMMAGSDLTQNALKWWLPTGSGNEPPTSNPRRSGLSVSNWDETKGKYGYLNCSGLNGELRMSPGSSEKTCIWQVKKRTPQKLVFSPHFFDSPDHLRMQEKSILMCFKKNSSTLRFLKRLLTHNSQPL